MRRWCGRCWCQRRCGCSATGTGGHRGGCPGSCGQERGVSHTKGLLLLVSVALIVGCARPVAPLAEVPQPSPTPAAPISFPRDAGPHDGLSEWWYYTGHLTSAQGQAYGFEFVIFQVRRQDAPTGYLAHFAIS